MKYYSYIFLRKNLIPEQVAIQTAHVAMKAALNFTWSAYDNLSPDNLNYVLTPMFTHPVELQEILTSMDIYFVNFQDFLYTFEDGELKQALTLTTTAIMTRPIAEDNRGILKALPLYRIK